MDERSADLEEARTRSNRACRDLARHVPIPRYSATCVPALRRGSAPDNSGYPRADADPVLLAITGIIASKTHGLATEPEAT